MVCFLLVILQPCLGVIELKAHRGIQYKTSLLSGESETEAQIFGTQEAFVDFEAVALGPGISSDGVGRKMVVTSLEDFDDRHLNFVSGKLGGLLVILPAEETDIGQRTDSSRLSQAQMDKWRTFERKLVLGSHPVSLYYALQTPELASVYQDLTRKSTEVIHAVNPFRNLFQMSNALNKAPTPVKAHDIFNLHTLVRSSPGASSSTARQKPIIALVAYYDSLSSAPSLAHGADANGSGLAILLELARVFRRLISTSRTVASHDILFVLTGGDQIGFEGTKAWLRDIDPLVADRIAYALCLDSLAAANQESLRLHVSRSPKTEAIAQLYEIFGKVAANLSIDFELVHKKINLADPIVYWQHEQFSRKKITAGTLSHLPEAATPFEKLNILDRSYSLSLLVRNTRFIAESLGKYLFSIPTTVPPELFEKDLAISGDHLQFTMSQLTRYPRITAYQTPPPAKDDKPQLPPYLVTIAQSLSALTETETVRTTFTGPEAVTYYEPTLVDLRIYTVKPFSFEIVVALTTFCYLLLFFVFTHPQGVKPAIETLQSLLKPQGKSKSN